MFRESEQMEYRSHFYITLLRNASQKVRSSNTLTEITIQLAQRIDLGSTDNWEVGLCEFNCPPPKSGTWKPVDIVGETNALINCDLITPQFVGSDYVRCCGRLFNRQSIVTTHFRMSIMYASKNVPSSR